MRHGYRDAGDDSPAWQARRRPVHGDRAARIRRDAPPGRAPLPAAMRRVSGSRSRSDQHMPHVLTLLIQRRHAVGGVTLLVQFVGQRRCSRFVRVRSYQYGIVARCVARRLEHRLRRIWDNSTGADRGWRRDLRHTQPDDPRDRSGTEPGSHRGKPLPQPAKRIETARSQIETVGGSVDHGLVDLGRARRESCQQRAITEQVDQAWDPTGVSVQPIESARLEADRERRTCHPKSVLDVASHLRASQRPQPMPNRDPLVELTELG